MLARVAFGSWEMPITADGIANACDALLSLHSILGRKPTVPDVAPLVRAYEELPGNAGGGSLHIILEDCNVEDDHVSYCAEYARKQGDRAGERLASVLHVMSKTQRRKL